MFPIRPISDLRNRFTEISAIVHEKQEPIILTRNGYGDMVVMSYECFERRLQGRGWESQAEGATEGNAEAAGAAQPAQATPPANPPAPAALPAKQKSADPRAAHSAEPTPPQRAPQEIIVGFTD